MILSIPNSRHVRVWGGLVFRGRFDYQERGVLDKGHLRFFALSNLREMFAESGLVIEKMIWRQALKGRLLGRISFGI